MDIRPKNINLNSKGLLPVVIFGAEDFDVEDIDLLSLLLAVPTHVVYLPLELRGATPVTRGKSGKVGSFTDFNHDSITDVLLHFDKEDIDIPDYPYFWPPPWISFPIPTSYYGSIPFGETTLDIPNYSYSDAYADPLIYPPWMSFDEMTLHGLLTGTTIFGNDSIRIVPPDDEDYGGQIVLPGWFTPIPSVVDGGPIAIPEPATLGVLLLGGLVLLRRKQRSTD